MSAIVVMKLGGQIASGDLHNTVQTTRQLQAMGKHVVWVHGGGASITRALEHRGIVLPFVDGQRLTTPEAMEVVTSVLYTDINPRLVNALQSARVPAVGISAGDGILVASPLHSGSRTGRIVDTRVTNIKAQLNDGNVPVIAPIGVDGQGLHYNINADAAAAAIASALGAERMVFLTDVHGVYEDMHREEVIHRINAATLCDMLVSGCFQGGMVPKARAILTAMQAGVQAVFVVHGQDFPAIQWAVGLANEAVVSSDGVRGTCITPGEGIA
jgi:acetylglutamate kinase